MASFAARLMIVCSVVCLHAAVSEAQSISFGPNGIEILRDGKQIDVNRMGEKPRSSDGRRSTTQNGTRGGNSARKKVRPNLVVTNRAAFSPQKVAESALKSEQVEFAAYVVDYAVQKDSQNGLLRLFSSHVHFAAGDYAKAASELNWATQNISKTQWNLIVENIERLDSRENYASQQNKLAEYLSANPQSNEARVIYGFHAMANGKRDLAIQEFSNVLSVEPTNSLATRMKNTMVTPAHHDRAVTIRKGAHNTLHIRSNPPRSE